MSEHDLMQENNDQTNCFGALPYLDSFRYKTIVYTTAIKTTVVELEAIEDDDD